MSSIEASGSKDDASTATLHVMQAIMAVAVLTSHWEYPYDLQYVAQFKVPVDYFFFIEGFLTMQGLFRAAPAPPTWRVIVRRIWRIYPLHVIGLIAGAATFFAAARAQENGWSIDFLEKSLGLGLLLQPIFSAVNEGAVFPLNSPSWAFVVEIWAFAVLFLSRRHLTMRVTGLIFLSAAIVLLAWILLTHDSNLGWRTPNYWGGFPRAICGFFGGAYLIPAQAEPIVQASPIASAADLGRCCCVAGCSGTVRLVSTHCAVRRPADCLVRCGEFEARMAVTVWSLGGAACLWHLSFELSLFRGFSRVRSLLHPAQANVGQLSSLPRSSRVDHFGGASGRELA